MKRVLIILVALAVFWIPDYLWAMSPNTPATFLSYADDDICMNFEDGTLGFH